MKPIRNSGARCAPETRREPRIAVLLALLLCVPAALVAWHGVVPSLRVLVDGIEAALHAVVWVLVTLLVVGGIL